MADDRIQVRKVTDVHANWSAAGPDEPGKFSFQLMLDDGAEEYVARPAPPAAKVLLKLIESSDSTFIDTERGAVAFRGVRD